MFIENIFCSPERLIMINKIMEYIQHDCTCIVRRYSRTQHPCQAHSQGGSLGAEESPLK